MHCGLQNQPCSSIPTSSSIPTGSVCWFPLHGWHGAPSLVCSPHLVLFSVFIIHLCYIIVSKRAFVKIVISISDTTNIEFKQTPNCPTPRALTFTRHAWTFVNLRKIPLSRIWLLWIRLSFIWLKGIRQSLKFDCLLFSTNNLIIFGCK